jgi:hypothetical protein
MTIPVKTALGQEELKSRTHRLSQRHRTVLLLVDGRRPLSEVLSLAQQAGAATSHFEELVRLGLVDVPTEPEPQPERVEVASAPAPLAPLAPPTPADEPPTPADEAPQVAEVQLDATAAGSPVDDVATDDTAAAEAAIQPPAATMRESIVVPAPEPKPAPAPPRELPVPAELADVDALQAVRALLIETLRIDAPLFSARMFVRVRNARTSAELIELVWEIQDNLARARHAQRELRSLQLARELLGLGNTLVSEDSTRPPLDQE